MKLYTFLSFIFLQHAICVIKDKKGVSKKSAGAGSKYGDSSYLKINNLNSTYKKTKKKRNPNKAGKTESPWAEFKNNKSTDNQKHTSNTETNDKFDIPKKDDNSKKEKENAPKVNSVGDILNDKNINVSENNDQPKSLNNDQPKSLNNDQPKDLNNDQPKDLNNDQPKDLNNTDPNVVLTDANSDSDILNSNSANESTLDESETEENKNKQKNNVNPNKIGFYDTYFYYIWGSSVLLVVLVGAGAILYA